MGRPRKTSEANIYHVLNRGTGKQLIFEDDWDCKAFLERLCSALADNGVAMLAYCLMGNHFHLLLEGLLPDIASAMQAVCTWYSRRFNRRHGRTGHLLQGPFKSEAVNDGAYLLTVVRYIHQNPLKAGFSNDCYWKWSSYSEYVGAASKCLCDQSLVLDAFDGVEGFASSHRELCVDGECLDIDTMSKRTCGPTDGQALEFANSILNGAEVGSIKELGKKDRDAALALLRSRGLTVKQIQRLTGIGTSIISRAKNANYVPGT